MSKPKEVGRSSVVADRIRQFVLEQFPLARRRPPSDDDALLQSGIVDSLGILELVNFVTEQFNVEVTDEDLLPENFNSVGSLAAFVVSRSETDS